MTHKTFHLLAAAALIAAALPAAAAPWRFSVTGLGSFNPTGINNAGQVSGWSNGDAGPLAVLHNGSTLATIGSPSGRSFAYGINDAGQLAGTYGDDNSVGAGHAYSYSGSGFSSLAPAGSAAIAINNAGQVAGSLQLDDDGNSHAFLYSNHTLTDLTAGKPAGAGSTAFGLSNNGQVAGSMWDSAFGEHHAFVYANGVTTDLSTVVSGYSNALGVNDAGQVILTVDRHGPGTRSSYLYSGGVATDLGSLGGDTYAHSINSAGIVVGAADSFNWPFQSGGFIWQNGELQDLNSLIDPASGWTIVNAAGINDHNQIAAFGCRAGECQGLLLNVQAVPEAETWALFSAGFGLVGYAARRRRAGKAA